MFIQKVTLNYLWHVFFISVYRLQLGAVWPSDICSGDVCTAHEGTWTGHELWNRLQEWQLMSHWSTSIRGRPNVIFSFVAQLVNGRHFAFYFDKAQIVFLVGEMDSSLYTSLLCYREPSLHCPMGNAPTFYVAFIFRSLINVLKIGLVPEDSLTGWFVCLYKKDINTFSMLWKSWKAKFSNAAVVKILFDCVTCVSMVCYVSSMRLI